MSNQTIYTCDRCGKTSHQLFSDGGTKLTHLFSDRSYDLCYDCKEKFLRFIRRQPIKD